MHESGFSVTDFSSDDEKTVGFKILFENGYIISFIFGTNSASDEIKMKKTANVTEYFCKNAEIAVLNEKQEIVPFNKEHSVKSFAKPEEVAQIISWAVNR